MKTVCKHRQTMVLNRGFSPLLPRDQHCPNPELLENDALQQAPDKPASLKSAKLTQQFNLQEMLLVQLGIKTIVQHIS